MTPIEIVTIVIGAVSLVVLIVLISLVVQGQKAFKDEQENRRLFEDGVGSRIDKLQREVTTFPRSISQTPAPIPVIEKVPSPEVPTGAQFDELKQVLASLDMVLQKLSTEIVEQNRSSHDELMQSVSRLQARMLEITATENFLDLIDDQGERRRALLNSIRRLGDDELVTRLAIAYPSGGALSILQDMAVSGRGNEMVGWALLGVADKQKQAGQLEAAEMFYKHALLALENCLGTDHEDVAETLESLASIAINQGREIEAEELLERCGKIRSKLHGDEHTKVAESSIRLADLYMTQSRFQEALPLFERALEISQKVLGPNHEQCIGLLAKLADLHEAVESPMDVAEVYEQMAAIQSGKELEDTLQALITIYETSSHWSHLESKYHRLIELQDNLDADSQLKTLEYTRSLARTYKRQDKMLEATEVLRNGLSKTESLPISSHEEFIGLVDELSDSLIELDSLKEAAPYVMHAFQDSLSNTESDRFRRILGKVKIVAERLILEKEFDVAEDMYQQALSGMEKLKEPPKKAIIGLLRKIGSLCAQIEDYEKSEAAMRRAVKITESLFGPDHAETLQMLMQLGHLLQKAGKIQESKSLYERVLEMRYKIFGEKHADIVESLVELAKLCAIQDDPTEAEIYHESAVEMARSIYGGDAPQVLEVSEAIARISGEAARSV